MRINYEVNEENVLVGWTEIPFDENKPWIEVEEGVELHVGFDMVIDGILVKCDEAYEQYQAELKEKHDRQIQIHQLKKKLADTDYQAIKHSEGLISGEEYETIKNERQSWRDEINKLESLLWLDCLVKLIRYLNQMVI